MLGSTLEMTVSVIFSGVEMISLSNAGIMDFCQTIIYSAPIKSNTHHFFKIFSPHLFCTKLNGLDNFVYTADICTNVPPISLICITFEVDFS